LQPKQIICVKWGTRYGADYVNRLYGMAARHVSGPMRFVCLTDDRTGIRREVECADLPELGCEHPRNTRGKWRKVVLWGRELAGLSGPALFVDLDSVVVGSLDGYFEFGEANDVILARNWAKPLQRLGQTSVFRFPVGAYPHILERFRADPQGVADRYRFEQHYITASVPGGVKLWPERWTRHFRLHCLPPFPLRYFVPARLPRDARIVTFPGGPNPDDIVLGRWNDRSPPHPSLAAHLGATFDRERRIDASAWRHLTRYVLPVPWVAENWRE
jgi:hypothetical protein